MSVSTCSPLRPSAARVSTFLADGFVTLYLTNFDICKNKRVLESYYSFDLLAMISHILKDIYNLKGSIFKQYGPPLNWELFDTARYTTEASGLQILRTHFHAPLEATPLLKQKSFESFSLLCSSVKQPADEV